MRFKEETKLIDTILKGSRFLLSLKEGKEWWDIGAWGDARPLSHLLIMLKLIMKEPPTNLIYSLIFRLKNLQNPDGGWSLYQGGNSDLPTTIEAYIGLRLNNLTITDPVIERAKSFIEKRGGIRKVKGVTKILLAILELIEWREVILPPLSFLKLKEDREKVDIAGDIISFLHILPCMILKYYNFKIDYESKESLRKELGNGSFIKYRIIGGLIEPIEQLFDLTTLTNKAIYLIKEYQDSDGSIAGILTATELSWFLGKCLKLNREETLIKGTEKAILEFARSFESKKEKTKVIKTKTRDTIYVTYILAKIKNRLRDKLDKDTYNTIKEGNLSTLEWLRKQRVFMNPGYGWNYCGAEANIADIDDTAVMLLTLIEEGLKEPLWEELKKEALDWILSMRREDGGFGLISLSKHHKIKSYKLFSTNEFYKKIPLITEESSIDATYRIIEVLRRIIKEPLYKSYYWDYLYSALSFIIKKQHIKGYWISRLNPGFIHGTSLGIQSLAWLKKEGKINKVAKRGVIWLEINQNRDGGWGEDPLSIEKMRFIPYRYSQPWHTATALKGLLSYYRGKENLPLFIKKGIETIIAQQNPLGFWEEELPSGITIPGLIYLYHPVETNVIALDSILSYYEIQYK